jgi:hypothetical protein
MVGVLRPFTVSYYYEPQQSVLGHRWPVDLGHVWNQGKGLLLKPPPVSVSRPTCLPASEDRKANTAELLVAEAVPVAIQGLPERL